jgi:hypothetical protein
VYQAVGGVRNQPIGGLLARMRDDRCGGRPAFVELLTCVPGASRPVGTIALMEREGRYAPGSRGREENQRSRLGPGGTQPGPRETDPLLFRLPAPAFQPPGRTRRQRLPSSYHARALSRLHVIRDAGEQPAQLDGGRQLPLLLECGADRGGFGFGDDEHPRSMGDRGRDRQAVRYAVDEFGASSRSPSAVGGPTRIIDLRGYV